MLARGPEEAKSKTLARKAEACVTAPFQAVSAVVVGPMVYTGIEAYRSFKRSVPEGVWRTTLAGAAGIAGNLIQEGMAEAVANYVGAPSLRLPIRIWCGFFAASAAMWATHREPPALSDEARPLLRVAVVL